MAIQLTLDDNASRFEKAFNDFVVIPFKGARSWFPLFLITTATTFASAQFSSQHNLFPWLVAWSLAIGVEWVYLSGLAYADKTRASRYVWSMVGSGAFTSALFGVLYILGEYKVIPDNPEGLTAFGLALAHVLPLIMVLFCYTLVKRQYVKEQQAANDFLAELDRREKERQSKIADLRLAVTEAKARETIAKLSSVSNDYCCPSCGMQLNAKQFAAAKRWGKCKRCNAT